MRIKRLLAGAAIAGLFASVLVAAPAQAVNIGDDGCTPGYWKNHTDNWQEYRPGKKLNTEFTLGSFDAKWGDKTFLDALRFQGGSGLDGAFQILMRSSVAAFLNAAHEGLGYPLRRYNEPGNMLQAVNAALASGSRATMITLAQKFDSLNNSDCPLN